jgi:hypothetical protein
MTQFPEPGPSLHDKFRLGKRPSHPTVCQDKETPREENITILLLLLDKTCRQASEASKGQTAQLEGVCAKIAEGTN